MVRKPRALFFVERVVDQPEPVVLFVRERGCM